MPEPEHLEVERSPRHPTWLVLLVVVVVLGGLLIIWLSTTSSPTPDAVRPPSSTVPAGVPGVAPPPWPVGRNLPSGTLYVMAGNDVDSIDLASGLVEPMGVDDLDPDQAILIAMAPGILVRPGAGRPARRLWYAGGPVGQPIGPLRSAASILPASGEDVWTTTQRERRPTKNALWMLSGGLLDVEHGGVRLTGPGTKGLVVGTYLQAVGPDGLVVDSCTANLCTPELRERASGRTTALGPPSPPSPDRATAVFDLGALLPGNRFLAASVSNQDGGFELRVTDTAASPDSVRTIPVGGRSTDLTWLSDRWLVATSTDGVVLYDADDDTVISPSLPFRQPTQLVFQPTT